MYRAALDVLREQGAVLVEVPALPETDDFPVLLHEFARDLDAYLARLPEGAPIRTMRELVAWNADHPDEALKYGQVHLRPRPRSTTRLPTRRTASSGRATSRSPASTGSTRRWRSRTRRPSCSPGRRGAGSRPGPGTRAWWCRPATSAADAGRSVWA